MQGHNSSFGKGSESSSGGSGGMNNNQQSSLVPPPPELRWSSYASSSEARVNAGNGEAQGSGEASESSSSRNHPVGSMAKEIIFPPRAMVSIRNGAAASSSQTHHHHHHQGMDLNEGYSGNIGEAEPNLYMSSNRVERQPESGTSVPPDIDGASEGSDGSSGPHFNWGLSCKRKSFEGTSSQGGASSSSGSGSGSFLQPDNYAWNNSYGRLNDTNTFRLFGSEPQGLSNPFPSLNVSPGNSLRQIGAEPSSLSQHESIPFNMATEENARHLSLRHLPPVRNSFELRPAQSSPTQNPAERLYSPSFFGTSHASPWHGASSSSRTAPPNSFPFIDREEASLRSAARSNSTDHPIFAHDGLALGSIGVPSSTRVPSSSSNHVAANHPWIQPHGSSPQNRQRAMELAPWSLFPTLDFQPHTGRDPLPAGPSLSRDSPIPPTRNNNHNRQQPYFRSTFLADRHVEDALSVSSSVRALNADAEGRRRLISEIRQVLHAVRRGENLQIEDYMVFDPFLSHGIAELQDRHRDMRLDVDNMSYEELLALGERIGDVSTGLSEEAISKLLKCRRHWSLAAAAQSGPDPEPCCVCQEEYVDGDDIGVLDCGHDFHTECVKQWLKHKNLCPICKTTGLLT